MLAQVYGARHILEGSQIAIKLIHREGGKSNVLAAYEKETAILEVGAAPLHAPDETISLCL